MDTLYVKNGLIFWTELEIKRRKLIEDHCVFSLNHSLKTINRGFDFVQVEAPILTPKEQINNQYTKDDVFILDDLVLRPETTMGSYVAAQSLMNEHNERKYKLPLVVWQHGKSFRREQDQPLKNMRLKEFYQLEFQILFSEQTKNDYYPLVVDSVFNILKSIIGECRIELSDRLPSYSRITTDIISSKNNLEVCSISRRSDFKCENIEVAIGTDRCVNCLGV
jgi:glycyl-tRNA synthetase